MHQRVIPQFKGDFFFPDTDDLQHGSGASCTHCLVMRPQRIYAKTHHELQPEPLTEIGGRFPHIALLQLSRPALVARGFWQKACHTACEKQRLLELENEQLRATTAAQETHIAHTAQTPRLTIA